MQIKIRTVPSCPSKLLHAYQACEIFGINATGIYEVKTKTKSFQTTIYPFLQTDFLIDELIGKARFCEMIDFGIEFSSDFCISSLIQSTPELFESVDF